MSNLVPSGSVKQMMRHKNIKQTLDYAGVLPTNLSQVMQLFKARLDGTATLDKEGGTTR